MPEIKRKIVPVEVNYLCDKCGKGMMQACAETDDKGMTEHECMICGARQSFQWQKYPRIDYIGENEAID